MTPATIRSGHCPGSEDAQAASATATLPIASSLEQIQTDRMFASPARHRRASGLRRRSPRGRRRRRHSSSQRPAHARSRSPTGRLPIRKSQEDEGGILEEGRACANRQDQSGHGEADGLVGRTSRKSSASAWSALDPPATPAAICARNMKAFTRLRRERSTARDAAWGYCSGSASPMRTRCKPGSSRRIRCDELFGHRSNYRVKKVAGHITIGRLASATGIKVETVRYYEKAGLVAPPSRTTGNYRSYREEDIARLRFIRRTRDLGFSLVEIRRMRSHSSEGSRLLERRRARLHSPG